MSDEESFLTAFLAQPHCADTRIAYTAWLENRNDPRGEYLRLLCGLDEPTNPDSGGPARLRLRELGNQLASDWRAKIDRTLLPTSGLYSCEVSGDDQRWERYYLRFYPDGTVFSSYGIWSFRDLAQVWQGLAKENLPSDTLHHGNYALRSDELSFSTAKDGRSKSRYVIHPNWSGDEEGWLELCESENAAREDYAGVIGRQSLYLRHKFHHSSPQVRVYRFVEAPL